MKVLNFMIPTDEIEIIKTTFIISLDSIDFFVTKRILTARSVNIESSWGARRPFLAQEIYYLWINYQPLRYSNADKISTDVVSSQRPAG